MMGKDIEDLLTQLEGIKDAIVSINTSIYLLNNTNLDQDPAAKVAIQTMWTSTMIPLITKAKPYIDKILGLEGNMGVKSNELNNSIGSPWNEFKKFNTIYDVITPLIAPDYKGGRSGLVALLSMWYASIVDCKWALVSYNDYVQRGYDNIYNGNKPSVTINRKKGKKSTGNIDQPITNNVSVPEPSIDPY